MNLVRRKQDMYQAALALMSEYGIPKAELQAYGMVTRSDDEPGEITPEYIALVTSGTIIPSWRCICVSG